MIILDSNKYYNLGSVSMTSDINGAVSQYIEYIPFGEEMYSAHRNTYNSPYRYTAKELDEETGLYYYGARYYNPKLSIWLSVDPMAEKYISLSPYNYVINNPIKYTDPTGLLEGDYYNSDGLWIASDNKNDGKVYHADQNGKIFFGIGVLKEMKFTEWNYKITDSKFQEYFPTLLDHEGGFVNDPDDPGGATNKGITLNTFKKYANDLLNVQPTLENLKRLTDSQVAAIYEEGFWNPSGAGNIFDKQLGWLHFDTYLHGGASSVLTNTISSYGKSGRTIGTLNSILKDNSAEGVFNTYKQKRLNRFDLLIINNPRLMKYKECWYKRVNSFKYQ